MDGPSPAERNATAQRLISRKRLPEALDLLNETIRQDPRHAETFENRAIVFEGLGMHPQAQADRRKAATLRAAQPPSTPPPDTTPAEPPAPEPAAAPPIAEAEDANALPEDVDGAAGTNPDPLDDPPPLVMAPYQPPRRSVGSGLLRAAGVVLFALGLFLITAFGIYFALNEIGDSWEDGTTVPAESPVPTETDQPNDDGVGAADSEATGVPPTVAEALSGSPYSFSHLEEAWQARALAVSIGEISRSVTGFEEPGVDVTLAGNGATMELSVLIYSSPDAKDTEWTVGAAPEPKVDGKLPVGSSIWYNANAVVVVRVSASALRQTALEGFLALGGGGAAEVSPTNTPTASPVDL